MTPEKLKTEIVEQLDNLKEKLTTVKDQCIKTLNEHEDIGIDPTDAMNHTLRLVKNLEATTHVIVEDIHTFRNSSN
jgi:hypothetical protein